jgi:alpha-N-acetylglucosamine transferase
MDSLPPISKRGKFLTKLISFHQLTYMQVWASLITKTSYLPGLLALDYSLKRVGSKYPLVALYTDAFTEDGHRALDIRNIPKQRVEYVLPSKGKDYTLHDPRFVDTWTKLSVFGLPGYDRIVLLDADMIVRKNMDELMDLPLDDASLKGEGDRVFGASHACACNPLKKSHYPKSWVPENCAFTSQHSDPVKAQTEAAPSTTGVSMLNSGLLVVIPSQAVYEKIQTAMLDDGIANYNFPDQELLSVAFKGRWAPVPYVYNALKTLRSQAVHGAIWRDDEVKNVHYILSPKPWDNKARGDSAEETWHWWWDINDERVSAEKGKGIDDDFQ